MLMKGDMVEVESLSARERRGWTQHGVRTGGTLGKKKTQSDGGQLGRAVGSHFARLGMRR